VKIPKREINIFNMSLLDILTGALGAFLFLMIGMIPAYTKMSQSAAAAVSRTQRDYMERSHELEQLLRELAEQNAKLQEELDRAGKGEIKAEELERVRSELAALQQEEEDIRRQISGANEAAAAFQAERDQYRAQLAQEAPKLDRAESMLAGLNQEINATKNELVDRWNDVMFIYGWDRPSDVTLWYIGLDWDPAWVGPGEQTPWGEKCQIGGAVGGSRLSAMAAGSLTAGEYLLFYRAAPGTFPNLAMRGFVVSNDNESIGWTNLGSAQVQEVGKMKFLAYASIDDKRKRTYRTAELIGAATTSKIERLVIEYEQASASRRKEIREQLSRLAGASAR
jgi:hypothetical protein